MSLKKNLNYWNCKFQEAFKCFEDFISREEVVLKGNTTRLNIAWFWAKLVFGVAENKCPVCSPTLFIVCGWSTFEVDQMFLLIKKLNFSPYIFILWLHVYVLSAVINFSSKNHVHAHVVSQKWKLTRKKIH